VSRSLPKSTLNLPNRHEKSDWPKKTNFIWPLFKKIKAKGVGIKPKITKMASKKPN